MNQTLRNNLGKGLVTSFSVIWASRTWWAFFILSFVLLATGLVPSGAYGQLQKCNVNDGSANLTMNGVEMPNYGDEFDIGIEALPPYTARVTWDYETVSSNKPVHINWGDGTSTTPVQTESCTKPDGTKGKRLVPDSATHTYSAPPAPDGEAFILLEYDDGSIVNNNNCPGRMFGRVNLGDSVTSDFGLPEDFNPNSVGDPINVVTGNVYEVKEDLNISGRGTPLQFVRVYNSKDNVTGPLGYGWTHSYNVYLKEDKDGHVTEFSPQGVRSMFKKSYGGSYSPPTGNYDTLTKASDGTYTLRKKNGIEWRFNNGGRLANISDPNDNRLTFSYDSSGRLSKITDTVGRGTLLSYDSSGHLTSLSDPAGRRVEYDYDAAGNLNSVTDPLGEVTEYEYDTDHNMTKIQNPLGGVTTFTYDSWDRAYLTESTGGAHKLTLSYRQYDDETDVTDSRGNKSTFYYDQYDKRILSITDPYGDYIKYGYDSDGNLDSVYDQLGNGTSMYYDEAGNLTKVEQPEPDSTVTTPPTTTITYEPTFNRPASVTDPLNNATRYGYDSKGNLTSITDALGNQSTFTYSPYGQLARSTDPKGHSTSYFYDSQGNLGGVQDPYGRLNSFSYGAADGVPSLLGVPVSVRDSLGHTTDLSYDALGRTTSMTNPLTPPDTTRTSVAMAYNALGDLVTLTDERGQTWRAAYDTLGRKMSETGPLGKRTVYAYDTEDNLVSVTDPVGTKTTYSYDKVGRLVKESTPDGTKNANGTPGFVATSYAYDVVGRMTSMRDPKGQKTTFTYDDLNRLTSVTDLGASGNTLQSAAYEYDLLSRMTKATNPNEHATTYTYDALGQLSTETDPLGNATSYTYDANGNVKSRTDAIGKTTNYIYDFLDRLVQTYRHNDGLVEMSYDAVGNLTSVRDRTGTTNYAYDERDRLVREALPGSRVLQYAYDAASNRTSLTYPDGKKTLYSYDAANRLSSVTDREGAKTTYAYNAIDLPTRVSYPSGSGQSYTYDPLGRVTAATATGKSRTGAATSLARLSYTYDKNSNPTSTTNLSGQKSTFTYDPLDRLTRETYSGLSFSYTYDTAGNRKSMTRKTSSSTTTTDYTYDAAERMTRAGPIGFTYNNDGTMVSRSGGGSFTNFYYDDEGRLREAIYDSFGDQEPQERKTYTRDAFGRVASTTLGTTTTTNLYDGEEVIQQDVDAATPTHYTRGLGGQLIGRRVGSTAPNYYHHDAIGSVVGLSKSATSLTDTYSYTAFGDLRKHTGTNEQPYQYVGNAYDGVAKLYDFHARSYDAGMGRFTSKDPVAGLVTMPQTLNPYAYGINGPLAYPDPSGKCVWDACVVEGGVGLYIAGGIAVTGISAWWVNSGGPQALSDWISSQPERWDNFTRNMSRIATSTACAASAVASYYLSSSPKPGMDHDSWAAANGVSGCFGPSNSSTNQLPNNVYQKSKVDRFKEHLTDKDLQGARGDLQGNPIVNSRTGKAYDHLTEVREAQRGLLREINRLKRELGNPSLSVAQRAEIERQLSTGSRLLDYSEGFVPR